MIYLVSCSCRRGYYIPKGSDGGDGGRVDIIAFARLSKYTLSVRISFSSE